MRRQIRPFTVERKRGGRPVAAPEAPLLEMPPPPPEPAAPKAREASSWAAAEALFSTPAAKSQDEAQGATAAPSGTGRILPSLVEPPAPTPLLQFEEDAPRRRGRKPGSRNKVSRSDRAEQGPKTIENVMRNLFDFWAREDSDEEQAEENAAAPPALTPAPLALRRRGRIPREELPRGQRWKARLAKYAR